MNHQTSPSPGSPEWRAALEQRVLLRASGELPAAELAALDGDLGCDAEAAEFARFLEEELPLAAKAPRDFAAAAISETLRAPRDFAAEAIAAAAADTAPHNVLVMPRMLKWSAAAAAVAAVIVLGFIVARQEPAPERSMPGPAIAATDSRVTQQLSARLSALEDEISTTRSSLARGRYQRSTSL